MLVVLSSSSSIQMLNLDAVKISLVLGVQVALVLVRAVNSMHVKKT